MTSYFEIGGHVVVLEHTSLPSSSLGGIAAERPERGRNSAKAESVRRAFGSNETGESRPGLIGHYFRSIWFGGTEPTRRILEDPLGPRTPISLTFEIMMDQLENQREYFSGGNPWD